MRKYILVLILAILFIPFSGAWADDDQLNIFGYFQSSLEYQDGYPSATSFVLPQLNLFLQKNLEKQWTSFINMEITNSFSTSRQWGDFNLEEAWVKYRNCERFSLKLGLQIPEFNHLNTIKNRTPLLPYVIRPLIYEESYSEFIRLEEYVPRRAYVQAYGFLPIKSFKFDYAVYLGNSPNINTKGNFSGQSGIDTTKYFMIGSRIGLRSDDLKIGFSCTMDKNNLLYSYEEIAEYFNVERDALRGINRYRIGADLSFRVGNLSAEGEMIYVFYNDNIEDLNFDVSFFYGTVGYYLSETFFVYGSMWYTNENFITLYKFEGATEPDDLIVFENDLEVFVPITAGFAWNLNDRITVKVQHAYVEVDYKGTIYESPNTDTLQKFHRGGFAISVFF